MQFTKYQCLANDFILVDYNNLSRQYLPSTISHIADRRRGIGCDQVLIYRNPASPVVEIYNQDGTKVGMCGNGLCALGHLLLQNRDETAMTLHTDTGQHLIKQLDLGHISVEIAEPSFDWHDIPLSHASASEAITEKIDATHISAGCVNVGNPHLVFFVEDLSHIDIQQWGPKFETDELFPEHTNVGFVELRDDGIHLKVWERGAGYTQACGSGACAAFVLAKHLGLINVEESYVIQAGGTTKVVWSGERHKVSLIASPTKVFDGIMS